MARLEYVLRLCGRVHFVGGLLALVAVPLLVGHQLTAVPNGSPTEESPLVIAYEYWNEIWAVDREGGNATNLTKDATGPPWQVQGVPRGKHTWNGCPSWLPHGEGIAYVRLEESSEIMSEISGGPEVYARVWVVDVHSRDKRPLVKVKKVSLEDPYPNAELDEVGWFTISPDGQWIAFEQTPYEGGTSVYLVKLDGTGLRRIGPGVTPAWSPDGKSLALAHWPGFLEEGEGRPPANPGIFLIDLATGKETRLTDQFPDSNPAFSLDGGQVLFLRRKEIWSVDVDGSGERRVATVGNMPDYFEEESTDNGIRIKVSLPRVAWSPDRKAIIYEGPGGLWRFEIDSATSSLIIADNQAINPAWAPQVRESPR